MESGEKKRTVLAIDLKSFYASVECVDRGLDPFTTPLVVCDKSRGEGTLILAVSPYLKTLGIPGRLRLFDLPKIDGMIYAMPRMERYIRKSVEVLSIYLEYVDVSDMHVYSQDEAFLDITDYLGAAGCSPVTFAKRIIREIYQKTNLTVTAGIGENLFLAKVAMDVEAKHKKDNIAFWTREDVPAKLWPLTPLSKMWSIGKRTEKKLNDLGFYTIGDIAAADPFFLKSKFGVLGEELYEHANGEDDARIQRPYEPLNRSLGSGQVLMRDYDGSEAFTAVKDTLDELERRIHKEHVLAGGISLYIGYKDEGKGFACGMQFEAPTSDHRLFLDALREIYFSCYDGESKVRNVCIQAFGTVPDEGRQLSLFEEDEKRREKEEKILETEEKIRGIYGDKSVFRASYLLPESTALKRFAQIGGHNKL